MCLCLIRINESIEIHICLIRTKKLERNPSGKHSYMPLLGKTQAKLENKSMPLPDITQHNSDKTPLPVNKNFLQVRGIQPPTKLTQFYS